MSWQVDLAHSQIEASVRHMMISTVRGRFEKFTVNADINDAHPELSQVQVVIDAASINTKNEQRDGHLKSPDFLDVEKFPTLTFKSTKLEKLGDSQGKLHGDLTVKGVTKPVVLNVEYAGQAKSPWGTINAGFTASGKVNRKDWGLNWNAALETGGVLVGDDVKIEIEVEFTKVPEAVAEKQPAAAK
jgi:polyisoprenoid-binding protein YceI